MFSPWARSGLIGWAASPSSSNPGRSQRGASPERTDNRSGGPTLVVGRLRQSAASSGGALRAQRSGQGTGEPAAPRSCSQPSRTPPRAVPNRA